MRIRSHPHFWAVLLGVQAVVGITLAYVAYRVIDERAALLCFGAFWLAVVIKRLQQKGL